MIPRKRPITESYPSNAQEFAARAGRGRRPTFLCAAASRRYSSAEEGVELLTIDAAGGHWNGADG